MSPENPAQRAHGSNLNRQRILLHQNPVLATFLVTLRDGKGLGYVSS